MTREPTLSDLSVSDLVEMREAVRHIDDAPARRRVIDALEETIRQKRTRTRLVFCPDGHEFLSWWIGPDGTVRRLRPERPLQGLRAAWEIFCQHDLPIWTPLDFASSANDLRNKLNAARDWVREAGFEALAVEIGRIKVFMDAPVYQRDWRFSPTLDVGRLVIDY